MHFRYEEFELWFIRQELKRAKEDAKKADQVKRKRNSMSSIMTIFGEPAIQEKQKPVKKRTSIKEKYNYGDVQNDPVDLFHKYDVDESGELDAEELTEMMFELGIKLSDENMAAAKKALGITEDEGVDLWTFESWWNDNFAKQKKVREQMLAKVSADMRENYLPHIRKLFAGADKDKVTQLGVRVGLETCAHSQKRPPCHEGGTRACLGGRWAGLNE